MKLDKSLRKSKFKGPNAYDYLKKAIVDQNIKPGSRLIETKIADMLNISRTPLREALHKLERDAWIEKIPTGGFRVILLTEDDIEQTFGIRSVLEAYAARLAAENYQDRDLVPLEKKMKKYRKSLEQKNGSDELQKINTEFHDLLYNLSNSPKLIKMLHQLRAVLARSRQIILNQSEYAVQSYEDHMKMLDFIKNRDAERVEILVRQHISKGKTIVLNYLKKEVAEKKSA